MIDRECINDVQRVEAHGKGGRHVKGGNIKDSKQHVNKYFINIGGRHQIVCKKYFASLHGLSSQGSVIKQIS